MGGSLIVQGSDYSQTFTGGSSPGFTAQSGFTVTASSFAHGNAMTVTRSSGSWASRAYGSNAWLYDIGDVAYLNGAARTPMSGLSNGSLIPVTPSNNVWATYGQDVSVSAPNGHRIRYATSSGSRTPPNSKTNGWFYGDTGNAEMKVEVMEPVWPAAWGTQNNQRVYVSYWLRPSDASHLIGNGKYGRFNDGGSNYFYPRGSNSSLGNVEATGPYPTVDGQWYRIEYYMDFDLNVLDPYGHYKYQRQVNPGETSPGPREWRGTTAYNSVSNRGGYLYTAGGTPQANVPFTIGPYTYAMVATLGFDGQNGNIWAGQSIDIANIYVDPEWERFEISDSSTWSLAPNTNGSNTAGTPREVQGRWSRDSNTQCTVYINQGQFAALSGKYLWYVDDFKTATLIGQFN